MKNYITFATLAILIIGCEHELGSNSNKTPDQESTIIHNIRGWDDSVCVLPSADNGAWHLLRKDDTDGEVATLKCQTNFSLNTADFDGFVSCSRGSLLGVIPSCVPECKLRSDPHGNWRWRSEQNKTEAVLMCNEGYRINELHDNLITSKHDFCANGIWESEVACESDTAEVPREGCQFLADPPLGAWIYNSTSLPLQWAELNCPDHAAIFPTKTSRTKTIDCAEESWPTIIPKCAWVSCPDNLFDLYGQWIGLNMEGFSNTLICDIGYHPTSTGTKKCSEGKWEANTTHCEIDHKGGPPPQKKDSSAPPPKSPPASAPPKSPSASAPPKQPAPQSPPSPPKNCSSLFEYEAYPGGKWVIAPSSMHTKQTAHLQCNEGYEGQGSALCEDGTWKISSPLGKPYCRAKLCQATDPHGTWTTATHADLGKLTCHPGFVIQYHNGKIGLYFAQALCLDGTYKEPPKCVKLPSKPPPQSSPPPKQTHPSLSFYASARMVIDSDNSTEKRTQCAEKLRWLAQKTLDTYKSDLALKKVYHSLSLKFHPDKCATASGIQERKTLVTGLGFEEDIEATTDEKMYCDSVFKTVGGLYECSQQAN